MLVAAGVLVVTELVVSGTQCISGPHLLLLVIFNGSESGMKFLPKYEQ